MLAGAPPFGFLDTWSAWYKLSAMNAHTKFTFTLILLALAATLGLVACAGDPDPIIVYVTATPVVESEATATPVPTAQDKTLVGAHLDRRQSTVTPQPTPSGVQYGPITDPNYTPAPLHTPLPDVVSERPCTLAVAVPQLALYQSPDKNSAPAGIVYARDALTVQQMNTDGAGNVWAQTPRGWLTVTDGGAEMARLATNRKCEILMGNTPDTTLLGLHVLNGTRDPQVLAFVRQMAESGHPVGTIKGMNSAESLLNEIKKISPETVTVYRSMLSSDGFGDCPVDVREAPDPVATARRWMDGLETYWGQVNADYYEVVNECPVGLKWLNDFMIETMKIANERGRCLLLFSFSGGTPDMQEFNTVLPAYQYAAENPCQPGRTHGIAMHAYSMEDTRMLAEADKWIARRHEIVYDRLLQVLPEAAGLPVYLTEVGIGGGQTWPGCDVVIRDALLYTYQIEVDPYVKGFHLWSVGTGTGWYDITDCLPTLADELIRYYSG
jgi:hypothetical protein